MEGNVYVPYPMEICFDLTSENRNTCQKKKKKYFVHCNKNKLVNGNLQAYLLGSQSQQRFRLKIPLAERWAEMV